MTIRQLLAGLLMHAADARNLEAEVLVRVGNEAREVTASYSDGTFILVAGDVVNR